jgi:thiol-disulfide isomerase/thioredoxin
MAAFVRRTVPQAVADVAFTGPGGVSMKLSDWRGRAVLLNLWATWCAPCRKEMPSLDRLQKALGSDTFEVVALAVDRTGAESAAKFLAETKVGSLKLYVDATAKAGNALMATGMPTTILIGKDGREIGRLAGPAEWDSEEAKRIVEAALR